MTAERPPQEQELPGRTEDMEPRPRDHMSSYEGRGLLAGRKALITGGDSGIGRAVGIAFAKEGADVSFAYLNEHDDAKETVSAIEQEGRRALSIAGDLSQEQHCYDVVEQSVEFLGGIDLLVNNVATQNPTEDFLEISPQQWRHTFATNIDSYFYCTRAALKHMSDRSAIINTSSVNGLRGNKTLIDYSATKGAILAFTYALAQSLVERRIRVNAVAPGPVWTPLIPATFDAEKVKSFGEQTPMGEAAHPDDIAPSYVFFASDQLSGFYSGEVLAPLGGETMPG